MSLGERLIKNNEYDKGYAQAIEDAAKVAGNISQEYVGGRETILKRRIVRRIKALLSKGAAK